MDSKTPLTSPSHDSEEYNAHLDNTHLRQGLPSESLCEDSIKIQYYTRSPKTTFCWVCFLIFALTGLITAIAGAETKGCYSVLFSCQVSDQGKSCSVNSDCVYQCYEGLCRAGGGNPNDCPCICNTTEGTPACESTSSRQSVTIIGVIIVAISLCILCCACAFSNQAKYQVQQQSILAVPQGVVVQGLPLHGNVPQGLPLIAAPVDQRRGEQTVWTP